jgi:enoyl-CoA hydratase
MNNSPILFEIKGGGGWITLNRPQSLNALNHETVQAITDSLLAWEANEQVQYVIIQGEGRAFCAGGDLRMIFEAERSQQASLGSEFFKVEYGLNLIIHNYSKPYVAILDGLTMGGGMGMSMHGTYRVLTENSLLAMPETAIGFFPDVGAAWYLNRCPGKMGLYLGLTSTRFGPADALYLGLGTHYVSSGMLAQLKEDIKKDDGKNLREILAKYHGQPEGPSLLKDSQSLIDGYFNQPTLEKIFEALSKSGSAFARETLHVLKSRSPLSLRKTFDHLKSAETMTIEQVMAADLELAKSWEGSLEFIEGIRAAVIDKDQKPHWPSPPISY